MQTEAIAEIGISKEGGLYVRPEKTAFHYIYRAAMQIGWDRDNGHLISSLPKQASLSNWHNWTYADWFRQTIAAAKDEYGIALVLTDATRWSAMPPEVKA